MTETIYTETVRLNNCGGKGDSEQVASRSLSVYIEGTIGAKVGYEVIEGSIAAKYGQSRDTTKSMKLVAPPGTNMEFILRWTERTWLGNIISGNESGTYRMQVPVAVEQVSSHDLGCGGNMQSSANTTNSTPPVQNDGIFQATMPLKIDDVAFAVPSSESIGCVANEQTGYTNQGHKYNLQVPSGWVVVWDSWKAYWASDSYEDDGLLIIYGPWEGEVTIVNGEYCATPIEWADFAISNRRNANPKPNRQEFLVGNIPDSLAPTEDSMNCDFFGELITKVDVIQNLYENQQLVGVQGRLLYAINVPVGWAVHLDGQEYYGPLYLDAGTVASFWSPNSCRPLNTNN